MTNDKDIIAERFLAMYRKEVAERIFKELVKLAEPIKYETEIKIDMKDFNALKKRFCE